jgi:hypothetical protein
MLTTRSDGIEAIARFLKDLNTIECDGLVITPDSRLGDDLGLNSLSILLLVVWIKDNMNDNVFSAVDNVSSLVKVSDVLSLMVTPS